MQKITPFLWYNDNAEEAMNFYISIFSNARIENIHRYGEGAPLPTGTLFTATFYLEGQEFMVINGGPHFKFTEAISLFVKCKTQEEIDDKWAKLTANGGQESMCGWLKDKYGLSWQLVPTMWENLMFDKDPVKAKRAMDAMMKMKKLDIKTLKEAHDGV